MIERVARRLFWLNGQYADRGMKTWADATPLVREKFIKEALAAVDEMREPTDAMLHEGWKQSPHIGGAWTAMIDAALVEGK